MRGSLLDKEILSREIPQTWDNSSLRWISHRFAGGTPDRANPEFWTDGDVPWVNSGAVNQGLIREPSAFVTRAALRNGATRWVPKGSLLMALAGQGKTKGMVAQTDIDTTCNQSMAAICPGEKVNGRFLLWWLTSQYQSIRGLAGGDLRDGLNLDVVGSIPVPLPPLDMQCAIAARLDRETARIDALIERKQRQIEILQEKRAALINHAVTQGLDPKAKMKDSGIEWLGEIPAHWDVARLRYLGNCQNGISIGGELFGSGYPFVSYGDVYKNMVLPTSVEGLVQSSEDDRTRYSVVAGDVLFTRTSETIEEIGLSSVCLSTIPNAAFAGFLIRFRPHNDRLRPEFAAYAFRNHRLRAYFVKEMNLVTRASLSQDLLKDMPVLLPPGAEQTKIFSFLNHETDRLDRLRQRIGASCELLAEYRAALIFAAVTGKVGVREEVAA